ncbi:hypothetical protein [Rhizohabitans arisaemae]|uniref:hypothetical protein n=1 Tax=Rhizohabitans arisaemae TaxID=2720610 RepID=UPI0024B24EC2|nr:hypothetical protein [Rhizohabitans arisaemae]
MAEVQPEDRAQHSRLQADRIYLGWQYSLLYADPGPPPRRPTPGRTPEAPSRWGPRERRAEDLLNRPVKMFRGLMAALGLLFVVLFLTDMLFWPFALLGLLATLGVGGILTFMVGQGERAVRSQIADEEAKLERRRRDRDRELHVAQEEHARRYREWEVRRDAFDTQHSWYAVAVPDEIDRVDVVGGTLNGWSALVTLLGATRLYSGGHLTVLDLSEGSVAGDLIELARRGGDEPLVWVLPVDLPRLDLGATLEPAAFADVLAQVVSVSEDATRDLSFDNAILERVLEVLGEHATINQVTAALRALAQVGDPRDDLRSGLLTVAQLERIGTLFGRGAVDRVVIERAWAMEAQLRKLETLGAQAVRLPPARLRVVSTDRQSGIFGNRVLGTYVATALTHILRQSPPVDRPWQHTIIVAGADKLRGDVLDRLMDACESSGSGLVLTYRSFTPAVRERLGRGHAAVAFMRLGNADDARVAAEHIGTEHRLEIAQLTEACPVGDHVAEPYVSTVSGEARTTGGDGPWLGLGRLGNGRDTLPEDITSSGWGRQGAEELSQTMQRSREFIVEPHELQQLPTTSVIVTHATATGRRVLLADSNPAILTFPGTTLSEFEETRRAALPGPRPGTEPKDGPRRRHARDEAGDPGLTEIPEVPEDPDERPPPNLGPPPRRLDWRRGR